MPRAIHDVAQQLLGRTGRSVHEAIDLDAYLPDNLDIGPLAPATHDVGLSGASVLEHQQKRTAVIFDVQPVAHLLTVPVDR